jgi:hypothetical protein
MLALLCAPGIRDILYRRKTDIRGADPACRGAMSFRQHRHAHTSRRRVYGQTKASSIDFNAISGETVSSLTTLIPKSVDHPVQNALAQAKKRRNQGLRRLGHKMNNRARSRLRQGSGQLPAVIAVRC